MEYCRMNRNINVIVNVINVIGQLFNLIIIVIGQCFDQ